MNQFIYPKTYLQLFSADHLEKLPTLSHVRSLGFSLDVLLELSPAALARFEQIEQLYLFRRLSWDALEQWPAAINHWSTLQVLQVDNAGADFWKHCPVFPQLTTLILRYATAVDLAAIAQQCPQLAILQLQYCSFKHLSIPWDALQQLPHLQWLDLLHCKLKRISIKGLEQLPLKMVLLPRAQARRFQKEHPHFCDQLLYYYTNTPTEVSAYQELFWYWQHFQIAPLQRAIMLLLLTKQTQKIAAIASLETVLSITDLPDANLPILQQLWELAIAYATKGNASLYVQARLCALGELHRAYEVLQEQLAAIDITLQKEQQPLPTHVLLGTASNGAYQWALEQQLPLVSEQQVLNYLQEQGEFYLLQEEALLDNVYQLLHSGQEENLAVALELFEQGGFSQRLLAPLFFVTIENRQSPLLEQLLQLLYQHGSPLVARAAQQLITTYDYRRQNYYNLVKTLYPLRDSTLNINEVAQYLYEKKRLSFAQLLLLASDARASELLNQYLQQGQLDLSRKGFKTLPPSVYQVPHVEVLDVRSNNIRNLSIHGLEKLTALKLLYIHGNPRLIHNQKWRERLQQQLPQVILDSTTSQQLF